MVCKRIVVFRWLCILSVVIFSAGALILWNYGSGAMKNVSLPLLIESVPDERPTLFLYMLQTETCLPDHLRPAEAIGNTSSCQCDVLVLSFRHVCTKAPPPHVKYIFNSSTTWAAGRNLLYEAARKRSEKYLYYIVMDDDIYLKVVSGTIKANPWRWFEDFLKRIEPAVGIVDGSGRPYLPSIRRGRENFRCILKDAVEYVPTPRFDAAFNAFHYKAVEHLFPYTLKFDNISWWYPVVYMEMKTEVIFKGHMIIHTGLLAVNPLHRKYPRQALDHNSFHVLADELKTELPEKYHNSSVLQEWRKHGRGHETMSSSICLPLPPPHLPVKPFFMLDKQ